MFSSCHGAKTLPEAADASTGNLCQTPWVSDCVSDSQSSSVLTRTPAILGKQDSYGAVVVAVNLVTVEHWVAKIDPRNEWLRYDAHEGKVTRIFLFTLS